MERPVIINVKDKSQKIDLFIGRPSKWGNPFHLGKDGNRKEVCEKYRVWILSQPKLVDKLPTLAGKRLGCFCAPLPCHGDVLAELVELL